MSTLGSSFGKFKSWIAAAIAVIFLLGTSSAWSSNNLPKSIKYCVVPWFGSSSSLDEPGPDHELAVAFGRYLGIKLIPVTVKWSDLFDTTFSRSQTEPSLMANDKCRFYAISMTVNESRKKLFDIVPIYPGRTMVIVKAKSLKSFRSEKDLGGKKVAVVPGTTYHDWLLRRNKTELSLNPIKLTLVPSGGTAEWLLTGKTDFILMDTIQAFYFIRKKPGVVNLAFPAGENERIGWSFRRTDKWLSSQFEKFIAVQKRSDDSSLNLIFKKYFGVNARTLESIVFSSLGER